MLINIQTLATISEYAFFKAHPNVSFPSPLTDAVLAPFDHAVLNLTPQPEFDGWTYELSEGKPEYLNGKWYQTWNLTPVTHTPEEEENYLNRLKQNKLNILNSKFLEAENNSVIDSSIGFKIDATERSNRDINGLIDSLEYTKEEKVMFCAADNSFHEVTLDNLKTMQLEVIAYGQKLYTKKWQYREQINQAQSKEELDKIEIKF